MPVIRRICWVDSCAHQRAPGRGWPFCVSCRKEMLHSSRDIMYDKLRQIDGVDGGEAAGGFLDASRDDFTGESKSAWRAIVEG